MGTDHNSCEVVVMPETRHVIAEAKDAVVAAGFRLESDAPCIGNFAVRFTQDHDLKSLQEVISGDVIGLGSQN